jgi:hypothetical protein
MLQVDIRNAFNTLLRLAILRGVRKRFAEGTPWMATCYGRASLLFCGDQVLLSTTGVQQGDNAGPAGYCFGTHDIYESIEDIDGLLWQAWYMDDGTLVGRLSALEEALHRICVMGAEVGLEVNLSKCILWTPLGADAVAQYPGLRRVQQVPYTNHEGVRVLGTPVGHPDGDGAFGRRLFQRSLGELREMCRILTHLPATHCQYTLLRYCLDGCRLVFLLRTTPGPYIASEVEEASHVLRTTFGDILGKQLTDQQWWQACLPQKQGGMGIKCPKDLSVPARLASCVGFLQRGRDILCLPPDLDITPPDLGYTLDRAKAHLGSAFEPLGSWVQEPLAVAQSDAMYAKQHWWAEKWFGVVADNLLVSLPAREKARFALQRDQKGGPWLGVSPCRALGTEIPNEEFRLLGRYWLGAPLLETSGPLVCPKCPLRWFLKHWRPPPPRW